MGLDRRRRKRGSLAGWLSDLFDTTHDYTDDWIDRIDDFEREYREAADDIAEDRYYYHEGEGRGPRRYYYDDPEGKRASPSSGRKEEKAPETSGKEELDQLKEKIDALTKQVEILLQQRVREEESKPKKEAMQEKGEPEKREGKGP